MKVLDVKKEVNFDPIINVKNTNIQIPVDVYIKIEQTIKDTEDINVKVNTIVHGYNEVDSNTKHPEIFRKIVNVMRQKLVVNLN